MTDYEPIRDKNGGSSNLRGILIAVLIAFVGGVIATGWLLTRSDFSFASNEPEQEETAPGNSAGVNQLAQRIDSQGRVQAASTPEAGPAQPYQGAAGSSLDAALSRRVGDLEDRLSRINVQAQAASGNATRAEGLLIAFAARRALDTGSSLGYIREQLRMRFGDALPNAVNIVIKAAENPVTLEELQSQLDEVGERLTVGGGQQDFWPALQREVSELFVLRREGTPSPAPSQRLLRARRFTEAGNIAAAIAEIEKLPNLEEASDWLAQARRYARARDALDRIENAAILQPRQSNAVIGDNPIMTGRQDGLQTPQTTGQTGGQGVGEQRSVALPAAEPQY
ncbi:MAG: hypothetical protein OSA47_02145 [Novosphingopyxis baekryungensis]|nr:hypothetical protein [Novosphingopyxis baekryungensis]